MSWKQELKNSVTDIERLSERLPIDEERKAVLERIADMYPMRIPDYYLSLIDPRDPGDPIARMCVPSVLSPTMRLSSSESVPQNPV